MSSDKYDHEADTAVSHQDILRAITSYADRNDVKVDRLEADVKDIRQTSELILETMHGYATVMEKRMKAVETNTNGLGEKMNAVEERMDNFVTKDEMSNFRNDILNHIDKLTALTTTVLQEQRAAFFNYNHLSNRVDEHDGDIKTIKAHVGLAT